MESFKATMRGPYGLVNRVIKRATFLSGVKVRVEDLDGGTGVKAWVANLFRSNVDYILHLEGTPSQIAAFRKLVIDEQRVRDAYIDAYNHLRGRR